MRALVMVTAAMAILASACSGGDGASISVGSDGGGGDWCDSAREFDDSINVLNGDAPPSPEVIEAAYEDIKDQFDSIKNGAPPEIKADVETSVEGFEATFEAFKDADFDFMNIDLGALEALDDPKYAAASENVEAYLRDTCGIGDDAPVDDSSGDAPAADSSGDSTVDDSSGDAPADDSSGDAPAEETPADDSSDDSGDQTELPTDGTVSDIIVESLVQAGFSQAEASCLAEAIGGDLLTAGQDPTAMFDAFDSCGIDLSRLAEIGG